MKAFLKLAYLISAHQSPTQLLRLVKRLQRKNNTFYIYIYGKTNTATFKMAISKHHWENMFWISKLINILRGKFSLSEAYLTSFEQVTEQDPAPDFVLTLNGQDYPIATNKIIQELLAHYIDRTILDHTQITDNAPLLSKRVKQNYLLINRHYSVIYSHPNKTTVGQRLFDVILKISDIFPPPRKRPLDHQFYLGSNWFQLKPIAALYLVKFSKSNPNYLKFFSTTYVP